MEKRVVKALQEITFADLQIIENEVAKNENAATKLLVKPRTFFIERGYVLPARTEITIIPTEELKARLYTKEGLNTRFSETGDPSFGKIKIHVLDGLGKCVRLEIDCPCQSRIRNPNDSPKNLVTDMSLQEFYSIVTEAERNDELVGELIKAPREYFERKGYYSTPEVRFLTLHTTKWIDSLSNELEVDRYLHDELPLAKVYHISNGKGKCTHVEVTCDCPSAK